MIRVAFLAIFLAPAVALSGTEPGEPKGADTFATTTTHVELNSLGQFFKIEFTQPGPKPTPAPKPQEKGKTLGSFFLNFLGLAEVDVRSMKESNQPQFARIGVLRIPFFSFLALSDEQKLEQGEYGYISANLFALFDLVAERGDVPTELGGHARFVRYVVVDSIVFTLWRNAFRAPDRIEWEAFDLPLITTLWRLRDGDDSYWKVLNIPFLWIYRYRHEGESTEVHFVDGPGVGIFWRKEESRDHDRWKLLNALLVNGARGNREGDQSHFGVVESFRLFNGPFVALYNSDVERDERSGESQTVTSNQVLRLPFLGPLIGTWKDRKGGHFAVLPNVFIRSKNRPEAFQFF